MNEKIVLVTWYTIGSPYERGAFEMEDKWGASFYGVPGVESMNPSLTDYEKWVGNTNLKPAVLLRAMRDHPGHSVLLVDADADVRSWPGDVVSTPGDFLRSKHRGNECCSGTVFARQNVRAKKLVTEWLRLCFENTSTWDQIHLARAIKTLRNEVEVGDLPPEYLWIPGSTEEFAPEGTEPVIVHEIKNKPKEMEDWRGGPI